MASGTALPEEPSEFEKTLRGAGQGMAQMTPYALLPPPFGGLTPLVAGAVGGGLLREPTPEPPVANPLI